MRDPIQSRHVALLGRYLSFDSAEESALLGELSDDSPVWSDLFAAALPLGLVGALAERVLGRDPMCSGIAKASLNPASPVRRLEDYLSGIRYRQRSQRMHLNSFVGALNANGIEPVLLDGSHALWVGKPTWLYLQQIRLRVTRAALPPTLATLADLGYNRVAPLVRPRDRRETHWLKPELSGWIEVGCWVEGELPGISADNSSGRCHLDAGGTGARVRLLPPHLFVMHLIGTRPAGSRLIAATIPLKDLYEFAWWMQELSDAERHALHACCAVRADRHAQLQLWVAAAANCFRYAPHAPIAVSLQASRQWEKMRATIGLDVPWWRRLAWHA